MEEFKNSLLSLIKERTSTPILANIIIAWLIINWKIPIILFFIASTDITGYIGRCGFAIRTIL